MYKALNDVGIEVLNSKLDAMTIFGQTYIPQCTVPRRSVVEIAKFEGDDKEDIIQWSGGWNCSVAANGWTPEEEQVMLHLYLVGPASLHYRTIHNRLKMTLSY